MNLNDTVGTAPSQANTLVCSDVLVGGVAAVETRDLNGSYFDKHGDIVPVQIAGLAIAFAHVELDCDGECELVIRRLDTAGKCWQLCKDG